MTRRIPILLLAAIFAAGLSSCAPKKAARPPCPAGQQCLLIGNGAEPGTLDPALSAGVWEAAIIDDLMVGLVQNDAAGNPIPALAASWETSSDGLTWTFHLRDAQWSDGHAVTAGDFVYGLQRVLDPKMASEYASLLYFLKNAEGVNTGKAPPSALGARALDDKTLQLSLDHPAPYLLQIAKHTVMMPAPRWAVEQTKGGWAQPGHYVSTGPYTLTEWKLGDHITVVKNPRFFDAASVCLDKIVYYPTTDPLSAERRVKAGELDLNSGVRASRIAYLRRPGQMPQYVHLHTWLGNWYWIFNTHDVPAFKDRRVRQALTMAVDRNFITKKVGGDVQQPANAFVPPGVANYWGAEPPYWAGWTFERRMAEAKRILREAGYTPEHPLRVEVRLLGGSANVSYYASAIQSDWKAIGVRLMITRAESEVAYAALRSRDFQIGEAGWIADYNDPMSFLYLMKSDTGGLNYGDYHNPAYDDLLAKADGEPDLARRAAYLAKAEHIMLEDAPVLPLWFAINDHLVSPKVTGWVDNILDIHPSRYLCFAGNNRGVRQ
jgi:oligopeptide transport system substrate-binding protein